MVSSVASTVASHLMASTSVTVTIRAVAEQEMIADVRAELSDDQIKLPILGLTRDLVCIILTGVRTKS